MKIGIFDHMSVGLGGGQLVAAQMAVQLSRGHEVELIHCGEGIFTAKFGECIDVDLGRVRERIIGGCMMRFGGSMDERTLRSNGVR